MKILKQNNTYFKDKNIFIIRDHNWAFTVWETEKFAGRLKSNATIIHVDAHLDDVWDGLIVDGLHEMKSLNDIVDVTEKLKIENFIWAAVGTGTIDNVIYISQQNYSGEPFDFGSWDFSSPELQPVKEILDDNRYRGLRYWNIEEFIKYKESKAVYSLITDKDLILDLDLDYFNQKNAFNPELMDEQKILHNLETLRDMYPWSLVTVALSPYYCGGDEYTEYLMALFLKVFDFKIEDTFKW